MLKLSRLLGIGAIVRCAFLGLALLSSRSLPHYDTSSYLASDACAHNWPAHAAAQRTANAKAAPPPLLVWDAIYLARIAACGYEYEQYHAFFPGMPAALRGVQNLAAHWAQGWRLPPAVAGLVLSNAAFLASIILLARLSEHVIRDERLAATACLLFIFNPASIFHSAPYSESLFTLCTLAGLWLLYCHAAPGPSALMFALSSALRSNGLLNAGFVLHYCVCQGIQGIRRRSWGAAILAALRGVLLVVAVAAPYAVFQYLGWLRYCDGYSPARPWCTGRLPSLYSFVQAHYWGVGLFKYYELKQLPNFLLAAPALLLSLSGCLYYGSMQPAIVATLGLLPAEDASALCRALAAWRQRWRKRKCSEIERHVQEARKAADSGGAVAGVAYSSLRDRQRLAALLQRERQRGAQDVPPPPRAVSQQARVGPRTRSSVKTASGAAACTVAAAPGAPRERRIVTPAPATAKHPDSAGASAINASHRWGGCDAVGFCAPGVAVFVFHWAFMAAFAALIMHVQVATRFLSSCPPVYWWSAHLALSAAPASGKGGHSTATGPRAHLPGWLWFYCFLFMGLGAVMFPTFYPYT